MYYVSLKGVTGSTALNADAVAEALRYIKKQVHIPVGVGFGIRDAASARAVAAHADAVVIGSKLLQLMEKAAPGTADAAMGAFLQEIRRALDA